MQILRPTKSKSTGRYLEVLENFNQIEKRNSEIQNKPKRKPTKNITFYLRKDSAKYQVRSRPLKVVNSSKNNDSLCQMSELAGHGRSTSMFKTEDSKLQLSVDQQDFPRSSKS